MARPSKLISADQAVAMITSGSTLAVGGAGGVQEPDALLSALLKRFRQTGLPRDLTEFHPIRTGEIEGRGTSIFGEPGLLSCMIGGSMWPVGSPPLVTQILNCNIEAYNLPIGVMYGLLEAAASGRPGLVTKVGLSTCMDPAHGGGSLNAVSNRRLVEKIQIANEEYLFYRTIPIDFTLIRGTVADTAGNISMDEEPAICGSLLLAQAARANKGKVLAQVKRVVPFGSIDPRMVRVPGIFVDAVVEHPGQWQTTKIEFDPSLVGLAKRPLDQLAEIAEPKRRLLQRALKEARDGDVLAIGFGLPGFLPAVAIEQGRFDALTFTVEHGVIGGINGYAAGGTTFPTAHNPEAIIDAADQLRTYAGGGADCAFLGVGEIDTEGNVNVSRFGQRIPGSGGFIEITQGIRKIVFCVLVEDKGYRKFVPQVQQITFSAKEALKRGQEILYVTEFGVFKLTQNGLTLFEITKGIDVQRDIATQLGCAFEVVPNLKIA